MFRLCIVETSRRSNIRDVASYRYLCPSRRMPRSAAGATPSRTSPGFALEEGPAARPVKAPRRTRRPC